MLHQGKLYMCIQGNVLTVLTLLHQNTFYRDMSKHNANCCIKTNSAGKWANNTRIAASRQTLYVYTGNFANSTHIAASRHILHRHEQIILALLHQDKLCRKMSKQYSHCCITTRSIGKWANNAHTPASCSILQRWTSTTHTAASCSILQIKEQTILKLQHQDKFYRELTKQYLQHQYKLYR